MRCLFTYFFFKNVVPLCINECLEHKSNCKLVLQREKCKRLILLFLVLCLDFITFFYQNAFSLCCLCTSAGHSYNDFPMFLRFFFSYIYIFCLFVYLFSSPALSGEAKSAVAAYLQKHLLPWLPSA